MRPFTSKAAIGPLAALLVTGAVALSACSGPSNGTGSTATTVATTGAVAQVTTPSPTPTIISNVPFPLDPAPTPTPQPGSVAGTTGSQGRIPGTEGRRREGDREGHEEGEGGESGERGTAQQIAVAVTPSAIQMNPLTVPSGEIEFSVTNQTAAPVDVLISGNGVSGDSGLIDPGATIHLRGLLPPGNYDVSLGPGVAATGSLSATLHVQ